MPTLKQLSEMTVRELMEIGGVSYLLVDGERVLIQGAKQALVMSRSHPGEHHSVEYDEEGGFYTCTCESYKYRHGRCRHIRAIGRLEAGEADVHWEGKGEDE